MNQEIIELNVGGKIFRTTRSTLCSTESFFSRMLSNNNWIEGKNNEPIFIDRDHFAFDGILSFLRSNTVILSSTDTTTYLKRLLLEADYYGLPGLVEEISFELERRSELEISSSKDVYKVVSASEISYNLDNGWSYVDNYQGNETAACSSTGAKIPAQWRNNSCSACGESMSYEKYMKHSSYIKPTMIVLKKQVAIGSAQRDSTSEVGTFMLNRNEITTIPNRRAVDDDSFIGGNGNNQQSVSTANNLVGTLVFDQSFG